MKVRTLGAEHALVLPNSFESALAARSWGARWRVGYATDGRARLLTHPVPRPSPRQHQVDEYLTLLGAYGITPTETTPRLRLSPADSDGGVEALLREAGITPDATLVGLHLGAAFGPSKLWASERWVELVREMQGMRGIPVLLGSPGELPFAQEVRRRVGAPVPSLVGRDSSALLPRLLSRFDLLISGDTGVAHLAAAVGVGVVTLFGPTDPRLTAPRSAQARTIAKAVPCAPCFLTHCPIDHPCMAGIEVSDILEQLESLLWG
ncbi:MAG: glycosyltransferase family 9 protein [Candidatus Methylomirabilia bacterium]